MNEWIADKAMDGLRRVTFNEWLIGWFIEFISKRLNEWMNDWLIDWLNELTN